MNKLKQIIEGYRNHLFPKEALKDFIAQTSEERLAICKTCPFNSTPEELTGVSFCRACGCLLTPKSKCLSCNCGIEEHNKKNPTNSLPLKWEAVATPEQETDVKNTLNEGL